MVTLISLIAALALAAIPITIGWRRTVDEQAWRAPWACPTQENGFEPEKFARQTGTGLMFNQIAYGFSGVGWWRIGRWDVPGCLPCHPVCNCRWSTLRGNTIR